MKQNLHTSLWIKGAKRCLIKYTLAESLKLQPRRNEKLPVFEFGTEKPIVKKYPVDAIELQDLKNFQMFS